MDKVSIIYWSQTGNTELMAQAVAEGVKEAGKEVELLEVGSASVDCLKEAKAFALGCPAMGAEVLEEMEMDPFVSQVEEIASGKTIGLFGSYGWGDGQWMRDWEERMEGAGAQIYGQEGIICQEAPDENAIKECRELGKALASL